MTLREIGDTPVGVSWATTVGIAGAALIIGTVAWVGLRSATDDRGIVVPPDAPVPSFTSMADAVTYYEGQRAAALAAAEDLPLGQPPASASQHFAELDAAVAEEQRDLFPDTGLVARAGFLMQAFGAGFERQAADWDRQFEPTPDRRQNATGTAAEAALDRVSGGGADLVLDPWDSPVCPEDSLACVGRSTDVHVPALYGMLSDEELRAGQGVDWEWVMLHEYAHVIQNRWAVHLTGDPEFQRLFTRIPEPPAFDPALDYPLEHSAECMALALDPDRRPGYPGECTPEQVEFARAIWDGSFRG